MVQKKTEVIDKKITHIIKDDRQTSVRIPANIVDKMQINPKKDKFLWVIIGDGEEISLRGSLLKDFQNEEENSK
jgi:L-lysine 2,3-aminomutase